MHRDVHETRADVLRAARGFQFEFVQRGDARAVRVRDPSHMNQCPPITRRPCPQQQPGPLRLRFSAMRPGEWERFTDPDVKAQKRIRWTASQTGCECGWEEGTNNLIVKKKGRVK